MLTMEDGKDLRQTSWKGSGEEGAVCRKKHGWVSITEYDSWMRELASELICHIAKN
jgi:hypothetical protein